MRTTSQVSYTLPTGRVKPDLASLMAAPPRRQERASRIGWETKGIHTAEDIIRIIGEKGSGATRATDMTSELGARRQASDKPLSHRAWLTRWRNFLGRCTIADCSDNHPMTSNTLVA